MDDDLLTAAQLGVMLGLAPETVRWYSTQHPARLPPRVTWCKKPLWARKVVEAWIHDRDGSTATNDVLERSAYERRLKRNQDGIERPPRKPRTGRPRGPSI
jgi:hypothetical protein